MKLTTIMLDQDTEIRVGLMSAEETAQDEAYWEARGVYLDLDDDFAEEVATTHAAG
jgi:hypothetical protein